MASSVFWTLFGCCRRVPRDDQDEPDERTPLRRGENELNLPGAHDRSLAENARNDRLMNILRTVADNMVDVSSPSPFRAEARLSVTPNPSPQRGRSIRARTPSPHTPLPGVAHGGSIARAATPPSVPRVPRVNLRHVRGTPVARAARGALGTGRGGPLSKRTMQIAPDPDDDGDADPPAVRVSISDHDRRPSDAQDNEAGTAARPPQNALASLATTSRRVLEVRAWDD